MERPCGGRDRRHVLPALVTLAATLFLSTFLPAVTHFPSAFPLAALFAPIDCAASDFSARLPENITLVAADGIALRARLYQGGNGRILIYCHRLLGSMDGAETARIVESLIDRYDVLAFDFRGHRSSLGSTTAGGDEILDLHAAISYAQARGYYPVIVLGAGMGATVAMRASAVFGNIDALIAVSPSGFSPKAAPFFVRIISDRTLRSLFGRVPIRIVTRARVGFAYSAGYPVDLLPQVKPPPTLVINAQKDRFAKIERLRVALEDLTGPDGFVAVPGRKHAEKLLDDQTMTEIREFLDRTFPKETSPQADLSRTPTSRQVPPDTPAAPESLEIGSTIGFRGDVPIPEEMLQTEVEARLARGASGMQPGGTSASRPLTEEISHATSEVLSFHGYGRASVAASNSAASQFDIRIPRVSSVRIEGARWVDEDYMRSVLRLGDGYYNAYEIDAAIRRLASQPSIKAVVPFVQDEPDGSLSLRLKVTERRPISFLLATKFTDIDDFWGVGIRFNEFNPTSLQYEGGVLLGREEHRVISQHQVFKTFVDGSLGIGVLGFDTVRSRDDLTYVFTRQEVLEAGGEVDISYRVTPNLAVQLAGFGKRYGAPIVTHGFPVREGTAGGTSLKIDLWGSVPSQEKRGLLWTQTLFWQQTGLAHLGKFRFGTFQWNGSAEVPILANHALRTSLHGGRVWGDTPPQELLSLGGMTTMPGFGDDSFVGGRMLLLREELFLSALSVVDEQSRWAALSLKVYGDAGMVWDRAAEFEARRIKYDAGFEFDYMTALRMGIAWPLGRLATHTPRVYIGWGLHVI